MGQALLFSRLDQCEELHSIPNRFYFLKAHFYAKSFIFFFDYCIRFKVLDRFYIGVAFILRISFLPSYYISTPFFMAKKDAQTTAAAASRNVAKNDEDLAERHTSNSV